jgi:hypothetical protein
MTSLTECKSMDDRPGDPPEGSTGVGQSSSSSSSSATPAPAPIPVQAAPAPAPEINSTTYPNLGPLFARRWPVSQGHMLDSYSRRVPVFELPSIRSFFRDRDLIPDDTTSPSTPSERDLDFYPRLHDRLFRARLCADLARRIEFHLLRTGSSGRVAVTVGKEDYTRWERRAIGGKGEGDCGWLDILQSEVYRPGEQVHLEENTPSVETQRSRPHSRHLIHLIHYGPRFRPVLYHYPSFESFGSTFDPQADGEAGWFDLRTKRGKKCWDMMMEDMISIARCRTTQHPKFHSAIEKARYWERTRERENVPGWGTTWGGPACWNIYASSLDTPDTPAWTLFRKPTTPLELEPLVDPRPIRLNPRHHTKPNPHNPQAQAYLDVPKLLYHMNNNRSKKVKNRRDPVLLGSPLADRHPRPVLNRAPTGVLSPSSRGKHRTVGLDNSIEDRAREDPAFGAMYRKSVRVTRSEGVPAPRAPGNDDEDLMEAVEHFCKTDTQGDTDDAKERQIDLLKRVLSRRWSSGGNIELTTEGGFDLIVHMPLLNPPSSSCSTASNDDLGEKTRPVPLLFLDLIPPSPEGRRLADRKEADETFRHKMNRAMTDLRSRSVHHHQEQHEYLIGCLLHQSRISPILFHLQTGRSVPGKMRRDATGPSAWQGTGETFPRVLEDCENIVVRAFEDVKLDHYESRLVGPSPLAGQWLLPSHSKIIFPPSTGPGSPRSQVTAKADEIVLEDIAMEAVEEIVSFDTGHASQIIPPQALHAEQQLERS